MPRIHAEQAVYGSFPFWTKGYGLLAQSPGCRGEWVAEFIKLCQDFGEPHSGASGDGALLCKRPRPRWPWIIVRVASQGTDDRGRPGALAFHGLFVPASEFAKIGFDPFRLVDSFRSEWSESTVLDLLNISVFDPVEPADELPATAYVLGRTVVIESKDPIDQIARRTWNALTPRERRAFSVATLTFRDPLAFTLAATPRISEDVLKSGATILGADEAVLDVNRMDDTARHRLRKSPFVPAPDSRIDPRNGRKIRTLPRRRHYIRLASAWGLFLIAAVAFMAWRFGFTARGEIDPTPGPAVVEARAPTRDDDRPVEPDDRSRLVEGLIEMGERFHIVMPDSVDPTSLMREIGAQLRYRGRWLTEAERSQLDRGPSTDREPILAWERHLRQFRSDRLLPADFADRPLREQVHLFAWSYHLSPDPKRSLGEVPHAMIDALSVEHPVRPNPVESKYPALAEYARFLARLPRR